MKLRTILLASSLLIATVTFAQEEKKQLEAKMSGNPGYEELQKAADRISAIIAELDEKEMRWLELSERLQ